MIFQSKLYIVFLFIEVHLHLSESVDLQNINVTLFSFNHPSNCKRNEFYNLDYFLCVPCDSKANLQPASDGLTCECMSGTKTIVNYDSLLHRPICAKLCQNTKSNKCPNITTPNVPKDECDLKFVNLTTDEGKHIRVYSHSPLQTACNCDLKYNYLHDNHCIWKELLNNYLNYNAFWQRGNIYADLKFVAFFCQTLQNMTACNYLANLCVQAFFDTDKNSPCSVFLLAQASDATLYSSMGEELYDFRPYLFYKRGKDTVQEMEEKINYPVIFNENKGSDVLELFTTIYSLNGHLIRWGQLRLNHVNLCGLQGPSGYFQYFKNNRIACELSMETIIDLALSYGNKQFFNVFFNHTKDDNQKYMQTVPVLIENAFEGNLEPNIGDWQLVKRFQIIGAHPTIVSTLPQTPVYEDLYKLKHFKSIRILQKFELRCRATEGNKISIPLITLKYHEINITLNTSLNEMYKFELIVNFEKEESSAIIYKICLPIFSAMGFGFAMFRSYILKRRQNLECCCTTVVLEFFLQLMANMGNSFLATVAIDVFYIVLKNNSGSLLLPLRNANVLEFFIYSALAMKGFYFAVYYWRLAHVDVFFVDWERPKGYEAPLHLKNNLETSSQCSSIRTFAESNVSAWRIFFVANEWVELSGKQTTSAFIQGFLSLTIGGILSRRCPLFNSDIIISRLFACISIFTAVHIFQRIVRNLILNKLCGSPLQKFMDICALANVSIITLLDSSYGFYIHGRSPHGFSDTDMSSMILQLQRESQNMCGKRGLLSDSDFQTYVMLPPLNLRAQIEKLLPLQHKSENLSQVHFQKELRSETTLENTTMAYNRVNRFFCAFIDHAIKDMDYIIKEKSFAENLLGCEFESFLTENKGTFYIDNNLTYGSVFLYGNQTNIFVMELLLLLAIDLLGNSFITSIVVVCVWNKVFQKIFRIWVRNNVANKTLIDKRFLI